MTLEEMASRLVKLETENASLKAAQESRETESARVWFERFSGSMANDPAFVEMTKLGKEWRDAQRDETSSKPEAGAA
jgi:hypothetical protein